MSASMRALFARLLLRRASGTGWNLAAMATEALMVVFAVLVAFGVDNWRETRQLRQFAEVAQAAVQLEIEENWQQFRDSHSSIRSLQERIAALAQAESEDDPAIRDGPVGIPFLLPDTSSAAWRTAQASEAAPYFDYDWIISVSRTYEMLGSYERMRELMLDSLSLVLARTATGAHPLEIKEELHQLNGRLLLVMEAHAQVQMQLEQLVE